MINKPVTELDDVTEELVPAVGVLLELLMRRRDRMDFKGVNAGKPAGLQTDLTEVAIACREK